ncbi:MAG: hypothetical protein AB1420_15280 [Bacillota bacterium]
MKSIVKILFIAVIIVFFNILLNVMAGNGFKGDFELMIAIYYLIVGVTFCLVYIVIERNLTFSLPVCKGILWGIIAAIFWNIGLLEGQQIYIDTANIGGSLQNMAITSIPFIIGGILAGILLVGRRQIAWGSSRYAGKSVIGPIFKMLIFILLFLIIKAGFYLLEALPSYELNVFFDRIHIYGIVALLFGLGYKLLEAGIPMHNAFFKGIWYTLFVFFIFYTGAYLLSSGLNSIHWLNTTTRLLVELAQYLMVMVFGVYLLATKNHPQKTYRIRSF